MAFGRPPLLKGEIAPHLQAILRRGILAIIIAMLGIAAFALAAFFAAPFVLMVIATALFVGSAIYLAGIAYGIINDIIGVYKNLPYFLLGHQPGQRAVVESNKPGVVAVAWGILAVGDLPLYAAGLFVVATLIAGFFVPVATFMLPALLVLIPVMVGIAHLYSRYKEKQRQQDTEKYFHPVTFDSLHSRIEGEFLSAKLGGLDQYHRDRLDVMCTTESDKNAWLGNSDRNVFGYIGMPAFGLVSLATVITLTAVSKLLPVILFGTLLGTVVPVVAVGILAIAIGAALIYMAVNYYKQDDNKYKLDFSDYHQADSSEPQDRTKLNWDAQVTEKLAEDRSADAEAQPLLTSENTGSPIVVPFTGNGGGSPRLLARSSSGSSADEHETLVVKDEDKTVTLG